MAQSDVAMLMAGLVSDGVERGHSLALLTEMLDRLRPTFDEADFCMPLALCLHGTNLKGSLVPSSGGTGSERRFT
ncbi:hypothetical protein LJR084_008094 [Variovorax sp. LjRoot84]|uniref:hypothetical protein n=1 Tax=Variovorax sp. LjRoot84 TaxID=3342340 RepID=UPI003ED0E776